MNVLYISHLSGASYAGPTYSVPKQINAQSKYDNVFWYNATSKTDLAWKGLSYYHDLSEFPQESISKLPAPFDHPDLVVVEQFYNMGKSPIRAELLKNGTPYIIIPRGELTKKAQERKRIKKMLANLFVFKKFARNAAAIQYLTESECKNSGASWNANYVIIPNGIDIPKRKKLFEDRLGIKCVYIGRIEPYQKGLDTLVEACYMASSELRSAKCSIELCGPDTDHKAIELKRKVDELGIDDIVCIKAPLYGDSKIQKLLSSDVFLLPSRFEGHPMALIEAMSYGIPCLVTPGSNMAEEVKQYNAGWVSDYSRQSIASTLQCLISEKGAFNVKGLNALKLAENYEWERLAQKSHLVFRQYCCEDNR